MVQTSAFKKGRHTLSAHPKITGDEPAYPGFDSTSGHGPAKKNEYGEWENYVPGMTIRQKFAVIILQGLLSNSSGGRDGNITIGTQNGPKTMSYDTAAVVMADALIFELNRPKESL